jgi:hypothetical protein
MLTMEWATERVPSRAQYDSEGRLRARQNGKPLIHASVIGGRAEKAGGIRINGQWFVPACPGEGRQLDELWERSGA